jgi:hypothetical protein
VRWTKKWAQFFTFHAKVKGDFVPAVCGFFAKSTKETYLNAIRAIEIWGASTLGIDWVPNKIMSDNEAAQRAAYEYFGGKVCVIHY